MTHAGFIVAGYTVAFVLVLGYTVVLWRRLGVARRATGQRTAGDA